MNKRNKDGKELFWLFTGVGLCGFLLMSGCGAAIYLEGLVK